MTPTELASIYYPVYKLPDRPNVEDGVIYYYSEIEKNGVHISKLLIVDDASIDKETLAERRLSLLKDNVPLYKLRTAVFFLGDLIKLATPSNYFIDSRGKLFNYKKTTTVKLKFYKISSIIPIATGGAIIAVEGIPNRFKVLHTPEADKKCAGILHTGMSTILYGLYSEIPEDTRRKI